MRNHIPLGFLGAASLLLSGCNSKPPIEERRPVVPVTVAVAERRTVPVQLRVIGNVEPYSVISVKAQVGGELLKVFFQEGQSVRRGDDLFQIDPRPFELAVQQAEAALARDVALIRQYEANLQRDVVQADLAHSEAGRSAQLAAQGIISREVDDRSRASAAAMLQAVAADRAALESARTAENSDRVAIERAKLDLSYCLVKSPTDGRTGPIPLKAGNLVKANADTPLVVIHQVRPIYVCFSVPEQQLAAIRTHMAQQPLDVESRVPGTTSKPARGVLTFVDNSVDVASGMIRLKATFQNEENYLWPGQFVDVTLTLSSERDVTVIPSEAVQNGANGQFVYVLRSDGKVDLRPTAVNRTIGLFSVVEKGVSPGESVVTDGHLRLTPGAAVHVVASPKTT